MKNLNDPEDEHDYSPNELARLSSGNNDLYQKIVQSNLDEGDTVRDWQQRNLKRAQEYLAYQRLNKN